MKSKKKYYNYNLKKLIMNSLILIIAILCITIGLLVQTVNRPIQYRKNKYRDAEPKNH